MRKTVLLLSVLISMLAAASGPRPAPRVVPAKVGLVLIGATQEGFAVASDGSSLNADGRVSQEQKLFPAGKPGAVALVGTVSIQDPIGRSIREEVNVARIAGAWLAAHPDMDLQSVDRDLNAVVATAVNQFFSKRDPGAQKGAFKFAIVACGFASGKPVVIATRYFLPAGKGKAMRAVRTSTSANPGDLWIFGNSSAPSRLLAKPNVPVKAIVDPAVQKYHSTPPASLPGQDYLTLFDHVLRAAESDESKKLDGKRVIVAAPNRFATVTLNDGFVVQVPH